MEYNYVLKKVRYALNFNDNTLIGIFKLGKLDLSRELLLNYCAKFDADEYEICDSRAIEAFLNGLVIFKRGDNGMNQSLDGEITNNHILRKLKIALDLKDFEMIEVFKLGGFDLTKNQLSSLFRSEDNKHYQSCRDQLLRKFLQGMIEKYRNKKTRKSNAILDFDNFS